MKSYSCRRSSSCLTKDAFKSSICLLSVSTCCSLASSSETALSLSTNETVYVQSNALKIQLLITSFQVVLFIFKAFGFIQFNLKLLNRLVEDLDLGVEILFRFVFFVAPLSNEFERQLI